MNTLFTLRAESLPLPPISTFPTSFMNHSWLFPTKRTGPQEPKAIPTNALSNMSTSSNGAYGTSSYNAFFTSRQSIKRLFRCTVTPRPVIEQLLKEAEKELMSYKVENIFSEHERDGLKKKLDQYRSLFSPIHRLPPEVLRHIFTLFDIENWSLRAPTPAMAVAATCGRWREIAISTPSLWACIAIEFIKWEKNYYALVPLTRLFMDRSRSSLLEVILDFEGLDVFPAELVPSVGNLVQHSDRWRNLELWSIPEEILEHEVFRPIAGHLPLLMDLLIGGAYVEQDESDFHCDLFGNCPNLSSIAFGAFDPPAVHLPTGQIKSFQSVYGTLDYTFRSISSFPNIERLEIMWCGNDELEPYGGDHLVIHSVKHLSITASQPEEAYCAFKYTTVPQLEFLELSCFAGEFSRIDITWNHWDEQLITDFFVRSACVLTSLSLQHVPISDRQLIHFLQLMPSLESLRLEEAAEFSVNKMITSRFLKRLTFNHQDASPPFLPKLTKVRFIFYEDGPAKRILPKTLISRWIPDAQHALEGGIDCIKSIDIVLIAENEEPVEVLRSELQWMSSAEVQVSVAARIVEYDYYDDDFDEEDTNDDSSSDSSH